MWLSGKGNISTFYRQGVMLYSSWAKKIPQDKLPQNSLLKKELNIKHLLYKGCLTGSFFSALVIQNNFVTLRRQFLLIQKQNIMV